MGLTVGSLRSDDVLRIALGAGDTGSGPVRLHGELCAGTVDLLDDALTALVEEGAVTVVVDLEGLRICTSHGFDLFDRVHARLTSRGGSLLLTRARGAVARTLDIVRSAEPPFLPPEV